MPELKWSTSHAVFVPEIDDEHKEIFEAVADFQRVFAGGGDDGASLTHVVTCVVEHFAHEERLMRAARYESMRWHKQSHDGARKRVRQFAALIEKGDRAAGRALVEYLSGWLRDHTSLADRMLGAFLRNQRLGLFKATFQAGTKPFETRAWVDAKGHTFRPRVTQ